MEIRINVIEVASNLAHQSTIDELVVPFQTDGKYSTYENEGDLIDGENYKPDVQDVFNRWYDYYFEMITNKMDTTYFPVTHTCKADLEGIGFDTSKVDDDTMTRLASKLGDDYCEQLYWSSLPIIAEHLEIPKHKKKNGKK